MAAHTFARWNKGFWVLLMNHLPLLLFCLKLWRMVALYLNFFFFFFFFLLVLIKSFFPSKKKKKKKNRKSNSDNLVQGIERCCNI
jgi:hypothetical protein